MRRDGKAREYILRRTRNVDSVFAPVLRANPNLLNYYRADVGDFERIYPDIRVTVTDYNNDPSGGSPINLAILKIGDAARRDTAVLRFYRGLVYLGSEWEEGVNKSGLSIRIKGCKYTIERNKIRLVNTSPEKTLELSFADGSSSHALNELALILTRLTIDDEGDPGAPLAALITEIRKETQEEEGTPRLPPDVDLDQKLAERIEFGLNFDGQPAAWPDIGFHNVLSRLKSAAEQGVIGPWAHPRTDEAYEKFFAARKQLRDSVPERFPPEPQPEIQPEDPEYSENIDIVFNVGRRSGGTKVSDWEQNARMDIFKDGSFQIFNASDELLRTGTTIQATARIVKNVRPNSPRPLREAGKEEKKELQVSLNIPQDTPILGKSSTKYILEFVRPGQAQHFITLITSMNEEATAAALREEGGGVGLPAEASLSAQRRAQQQPMRAYK